MGGVMGKHLDIINFVGDLQNINQFQDIQWEGTFQTYVDLVIEHPEIVRTAYQRIADMILSYGASNRVENNKKVIHYHFFDDPFYGGRDAVFGLDQTLMKLVNIFRAAPNHYGTENRVILL